MMSIIEKNAKFRKYKENILPVQIKVLLIFC